MPFNHPFYTIYRQYYFSTDFATILELYIRPITLIRLILFFLLFNCLSNSIYIEEKKGVVLIIFSGLLAVYYCFYSYFYHYFYRYFYYCFYYYFYYYFRYYFFLYFPPSYTAYINLAATYYSPPYYGLVGY